MVEALKTPTSDIETPDATSPTTDRNKPLAVGVDDGYARIKLRGDGPDGRTIDTAIASSARAGRHALADLGGNGQVAAYETNEGESFTVTEKLVGEDTKFDGFHTSRLNRVLVQHALIQAGFAGQDVLLFCGVPVADYFKNSQRNDELIRYKAENLKGGVTPADGSEPARIVDVQVGAQAVASFFEDTFDEQGRPRPGRDPQADVAVVDVGGRTTDIATILGGQQIDQGRSGTRNLGVLDVHDEIAERLRIEFGIEGALPGRMLDDAVRSGRVQLWGQVRDVSDLVDTVLTEHEHGLLRELQRRLGDAATVERVLVVGGGAHLFGRLAKQLPNAVIPDQPETANARGLFKLHAAYTG